jgi:maltose phosphorylase
LSFTRTLDLRNAILSRSFTTKINNKVIHVDTKRILSLNDRDIALLEYSIKAINPCRLSVNAYLDANIKNYIGEFANQNKPALFWDVLDVSINPNIATVTTQTKPNNFNIPQFMST